MRDLDNLNYRKMKKILMVDSCETESTVGDAEADDDSLSARDVPITPFGGFAAAAAALNAAASANSGGSGSAGRTGFGSPGAIGAAAAATDSSKSNSITSDQSIQSTGISASSQSSSTSSIPPRASGELSADGGYPLSVRSRSKTQGPHPVLGYKSSVLSSLDGDSSSGISLVGAGSTMNTNHFATIRTTSIVSKQQKEHMQEEMHEQMSGYKRMRREHQGALIKVGGMTLFNTIYAGYD